MLERRFIDPVSKEECIVDGNIYTQELIEKITHLPFYKGDVTSDSAFKSKVGDFIIRYSQNKKGFFYLYNDGFQYYLSDLLSGVIFKDGQLTPPQNCKPIEVRILTDIFSGYSQDFLLQPLQEDTAELQRRIIDLEKKLEDLQFAHEKLHHNSQAARAAQSFRLQQLGKLVESLKKENAELKEQLANKNTVTKRHSSPSLF